MLFFFPESSNLCRFYQDKGGCTRQGCTRVHEHSPILKVCRYLGSAQRTLDVCVLTMTFDLIRDTITRAMQRGVKVRIISDFRKSRDDIGVDVFFLRDKGAQVRFGEARNYMHHKFAIMDGKLLLNGSFNWTSSAIYHNQENVEVTSNDTMVKSFAKQFEVMWKLFETNESPA